MKIKIFNHKMRQATLERIQTANQIIEEYQNQGLDITLRQLFYQLVARDLIPNNPKEYDRLGLAIRKAREAGLVDWFALVDRTRFLRGYSSWDNGPDMIQTAVNKFALDMWLNQKSMVECWVEKDALIGVIGQACDAVKVPHFSCRGYTSASEVFIAARRLKSYQRAGQWPIVLHLGDHDPSGIDMSRDLTERLEAYGAGVATDVMPDSPMSYNDGRLNLGADFTFLRIALNMNQVQMFNPPPNPVKFKDSRSHGPKGYISQFGLESWELDALRPTVLRDLIQEHVEAVKDQEAWDETVRTQELEREKLTMIKDNYASINFGFHLQVYACPACDESGLIPGGYQFFECKHCDSHLGWDKQGNAITANLDLEALMFWVGYWTCPNCEKWNSTDNHEVKGTCGHCLKTYWLGPVDAHEDRAVFYEVGGSWADSFELVTPDEDEDEDEEND